MKSKKKKKKKKKKKNSMKNLPQNGEISSKGLQNPRSGRIASHSEYIGHVDVLA